MTSVTATYLTPLFDFGGKFYNSCLLANGLGKNYPKEKYGKRRTGGIFRRKFGTNFIAKDQSGLS